MSVWVSEMHLLETQIIHPIISVVFILTKSGNVQNLSFISTKLKNHKLLTQPTKEWGDYFV